MSGKQSFKFRWEAAVGRTCYVASVKQVARVLAHYANADGTNARPGIQRIMNETSLKESAVEKALRVLIEDGWTEKASRVGVKRAFFDSHNLLMPCWLLDLAPGRPDSRREFQRAAHASKMKMDREAKKAADQPYTSTPDAKIDLVGDATRSPVYTEPDHPYTYPGSPVYTEQSVAGQITPIPTSRPTLETNHDAPIVAGAPWAPHAALPHVPHGVELANARSTQQVIAPEESAGPVAAPIKARRVEVFRNESNAYVAAAKKLDWDTIVDALGKWRDARADEYEWARKTAINKMGRGGTLKTPRGFERADRLTIDAALRMHLEDGNWHEALLEPLGPIDLPLAPFATNDLGDVRRRASLRAYFEAIRQMHPDDVFNFGRRFRAEFPDLYGGAVDATLAEMKLRPGRGEDPVERNRLACMQMLNTTKGWPAWVTDALQAVPEFAE